MGSQKPKKPGYWDNIKNIQKHLKKIIKKNNGQFPTKEQLRAFPYGIDIETAIMRLGMTLDEFRMQMGIKAPDAAEQDQMLDLLMSSTESFLATVRERKKAITEKKNALQHIEPSLGSVEGEGPPIDMLNTNTLNPEADISDLVPNVQPQPPDDASVHLGYDPFEVVTKPRDEKKDDLHDAFSLFTSKLKKYSEEE
ncbi:MAG: hypothetical protein ACXQS8_07435 [Candidatus Helarchaeales archaeon]